jgi:hypothetical protein
MSATGAGDAFMAAPGRTLEDFLIMMRARPTRV